MTSSDMDGETDLSQSILKLADMVEAGLIDEIAVFEECDRLADDHEHISPEDVRRDVADELLDRSFGGVAGTVQSIICETGGAE